MGLTEPKRVGPCRAAVGEDKLLRSYFRTFVAALVVGVNVALLVILLNITGWLEASDAVSGPSPSPWPTATPLSQVLATPTPRTTTVYVVKSGETLAEIAKRFGVSVQDIVQASKLSDPNAIRAGQPITIPVAPAR